MSRWLGLLLMTLSLGSAAWGSDFKIKAPANWRLVVADGEKAIYRNSQSGQGESVSVDAFAIEASRTDVSPCAHESAREVGRFRAELFRRLGFRDYTIHSSDFRQLRGMATLTWHASFLDLGGREVQALERQTCVGSKMFVVTYLTDGPALGDPDRIESIFAFFQPDVHASRTPASLGNELREAVGHAGERGKAPTVGHAEPLTEPLVKDLDLKNPQTAELCAKVPVEKRRTLADESFLGAVGSFAKTPQSCFLGLFDNIWSFASGMIDLVRLGAKYLNPFDSAFRAQTRASAGALVREFVKDEEGFAKKVGAELYSVARHEVGDFFICLKTQEQVRAVCNLALNFMPNELLLKIVSKAPLAVEEAAKISKVTRAALDEHREVSRLKLEPLDPENWHPYNAHVSEADGFTFLAPVPGIPSQKVVVFLNEAMEAAAKAKSKSPAEKVEIFLNRIGAHAKIKRFAKEHPDDWAVRALRDAMEGYPHSAMVYETTLSVLSQHANLDGAGELARTMEAFDDMHGSTSLYKDVAVAKQQKEIDGLIAKFSNYRANPTWDISHLEVRVGEGVQQLVKLDCPGCEALGSQGYKQISFNKMLLDHAEPHAFGLKELAEFRLLEHQLAASAKMEEKQKLFDRIRNLGIIRKDRLTSFSLYEDDLIHAPARLGSGRNFKQEVSRDPHIQVFSFDSDIQTLEKGEIKAYTQRYRIAICEAPAGMTCTSGPGVFKKGDAITFFPECGEFVVQSPSAKSIKQYYLGDASKAKEFTLARVRCR